MKMPGLFVMRSQAVVMYMECKFCGAPLTQTRFRVIGICEDCLLVAGAEIGVFLVVDPPKEESRWN